MQLRPGQQETVIEKLKVIQRADQHMFPGTIARYVIKGDAELKTAYFFLVWKDVEMPVDVTHQKDFLALREELADVLVWETAVYKTNEVNNYT